MAAGAVAAGNGFYASKADAAKEKPAILGGAPVRKERFPQWPVFDEHEERELLDALRSGKWNRGVGSKVQRFEDKFAALTGAKRCLATANGTSALLVSLSALDIGPGDEVILPPYTFVATLNVILALHALPVFVDSNRETFQIDAGKIEKAVTERTAAILPVHLGGSAADLDAVLAVANRHKVPVIEDACQAHLAEWKGRKVGTLGLSGCFSFQGSKNLNAGEGGAILTNDEALAEKFYAFHNNSRSRRSAGSDFTYHGRGLNLRLTEFQGALLSAQMSRLEEQSRRREQNAQYLTSLLNEVEGVRPARMHEGCTRNAYHLYMFRYDTSAFAGLPRTQFLKAMAAEGIPCSGGYSPLNKAPLLRNALSSRGYQAIYSKQRMTQWQDENQCPENDKLCEEAVWLTQNMLLGPRADMEQIAVAIRKIKQNASALL
jgi:dTDP-4-amino-4,6-dideoxygalactose transaminase